MMSKVFTIAVMLFVWAWPAQAETTEQSDAIEKTSGGLVLVAGATGRTGQYITKHLKKQGYRVRAMSRRSVEEAQDTYGTDYEWVQGDVRDMASLTLAMTGADYVICTIGSTQSFGANSPEYVDYGGVKNLVDAAKETGVEHFALISSMGVTQPDHFLNKVRGNVLLWKYLGEEHLRRSGLNYSVIRPGGLSNFPGGISVIDLQQGDAPDAQGLITREDVALVAIESLSNQGAVNKTFEVVNGDVVPGDDWRGRLALLKQDDTQLETPGASENQRMMPPASTPPAPPQ